MISTWPCPSENGTIAEELLVSFANGSERRVLIIPALFDEANKMRRFTLQVMRALQTAGIDTFLPDLPGQNESLQHLSDQSLGRWRAAILAAASHVRATEFLTIRAGAVLAPDSLPGEHYAPHAPAKQLRSMMRAQVIAAREAGQEASIDALTKTGLADGLTLAGWTIGAPMFRELSDCVSVPEGLDQKALGGRGLWLRAEPDEDQEQADQLASIIAARQETRA